MKTAFLLIILLILVAACGAPAAQPQAAPIATSTDQTNLPNPAAVYCEEQGYKLEIRTAADGSQAGFCLFPDGSECEEWAFYRGKCSPASQYTDTPTPASTATFIPTDIPTPIPVDPASYQGWWTYTHHEYGFSIKLPEDWVVEEVSTFDPKMSGHTLSLHSQYEVEKQNIRMTFRRAGEETLLWPTGVGEGEFVPHGTLDVAGEAVERILLICPGGEVTSIWYKECDGTGSIQRGGLEFGFIFSADSHCQEGSNLSGKVQWMGEMIIASLQVIE